MTASELADELEVSVRTIYRDVESLAAAGVPIYGEAGHDGGYRLLGGYRTRLTGLTGPEAEALFLDSPPAVIAQLGLTAAATTGRLKLRAALTDPVRERANRVGERFLLDPAPWYDGMEHAPHLAAIADATWNQHAVRIHYLRWAEPQQVTRTVQPHGLILKAGNWYLVARSSRRFRTYRISRIDDVVTLPTSFERAEGFELPEHWRLYLDGFDRRRHHEIAVVRLSQRGLDRLPLLFEPAVVAAAQRTAVRPNPAGWTEVQIPIESLDIAQSELLKLGAEAEVIQPEELRKAMTQTVDAMQQLYRRRRSSAASR